MSGKITVFSKLSKSVNYIVIDRARTSLTDIAVCINNVKNTTTRNVLSLVKFSNGSYSYILNTYGYFVGMFTRFAFRNQIFFTKYLVGDAVFLSNLHIGSIFHSVFFFKKKTAIYARSPGTYCILIRVDNNIFTIQLPSGAVVNINKQCVVTLGRNSNIWSYKEITGKAGRNIVKGFKQSVRGVAMNPVDHPHGGRTKTNSPEKTPWGKLAKIQK